MVVASLKIEPDATGLGRQNCHHAVRGLELAQPAGPTESATAKTARDSRDGMRERSDMRDFLLERELVDRRWRTQRERASSPGGNDRTPFL
jgi:hypothetical protein